MCWPSALPTELHPHPKQKWTCVKPKAILLHHNSCRASEMHYHASYLHAGFFPQRRWIVWDTRPRNCVAVTVAARHRCHAQSPADTGCGRLADDWTHLPWSCRRWGRWSSALGMSASPEQGITLEVSFVIKMVVCKVSFLFLISHLSWDTVAAEKSCHVVSATPYGTVSDWYTASPDLINYSPSLSFDWLENIPQSITNKNMILFESVSFNQHNIELLS